jgi:hypothetical protein
MTGRIVAGAVLLALVSTAACGAARPGPEVAADMEAQLRIYAAAAREYRDRNERWPEAPDELMTVLLRTPRSDEAEVRLRSFEPQPDGTLVLGFETEPLRADRRIQGELMVQPTERDTWAARFDWSYGSRLLTWSGTTTMGSCALGEYERPAEEVVES